MMSTHRPPDPTSGLVIDTRTLGRRAGAMEEIRRSVPAPDGFGSVMIAVPPGAPMEFDLRVESVVEGVLVSGTVTAPLVGECARCLEEVDDETVIDVQELYLYPDQHVDDEEASRIEEDLIDLEPLLRDDVVLELPFTPLCRPHCAGLCPTCGENLNQSPDHDHGDVIDPRWADLAGWQEKSAEPEQGE